MSTIHVHIALHYGSWTFASRLRDILLQPLDPYLDSFDPIQVCAARFPRIVQCFVSIATRILFVRRAACTLPPDEQPILPLDPSLRDHYGHWVADAWRTLRSLASAKTWRILITRFAFSMTISALGFAIDPEYGKFVEFPLIWFFK